MKISRTMIIGIVAVLLCSSGNLIASDYMNLEDAISEAIQKNPTIKAQDQEVLSREYDSRSRLSQMLPKLEVNYGYMRLNEEPVFTSPAQEERLLPLVNSGGAVVEPDTFAYIPATPEQDIPIGTKDNYQFSVEVKQVLFAGGALYNTYRIAKNDFLASQIDRQRIIRDLKRRVIEAYYGVIEVRQVFEVARSGSASIKAHLDVANAFYNQGMIPKNDLLEAQVRYAESEQNLIIADNAVKLSESGLNLLLGRGLSEAVNIDAEIPILPLEKSLDQSLQTALETRQEIKTLLLQVENASKGVTVARSLYFPSVAASYTYERIGEDPNVEDDSWKAGIGLNWNLFEGGSHYWDVSKAKAIEAKLGYLLAALKDQISLEVQSSYLSANEAQARIEVAAKAIVQAQENLRIQKDRYNLQVATTTNVLDAQALLDQTLKNHIAARADYAKALAELNAAMGSL
ncbi:MAG: TolC family protein [Desulfomonilia bacterium]